MIDVGPVDQAEVVLAFLRSQIGSPRWGPRYDDCLHKRGLSRALIDDPDLSDVSENGLRWKLAVLANGKLFQGFPRNVNWSRAKLEAKEFNRLRYIRCQPWLRLSRRTRSVVIGARNLATIQVTDGPERHSTNAHILALADALRTGAMVPELILVTGRGRTLVILDGHARATALAAVGATKPMPVFVGSAPDMERWVYF